jgi:hypothetical protein
MKIHLARLQLYQDAVVKTILVITSNHPKVAVKLVIGILKDLSDVWQYSSMTCKK